MQQNQKIIENLEIPRKSRKSAKKSASKFTFSSIVKKHYNQYQNDMTFLENAGVLYRPVYSELFLTFIYR